MLVGLFRSNQPAVLLAVPVLAAALFLPAFWHAPSVEGEGMPLAQLAQRLIGVAAWANAIAGIVLISIIAAQLALLLNALELMDRRNHLVALLFPVVLAGLGGPCCYDPALLGMPFVLMAVRRTWSVENNGPALRLLFDAGLLTGIAALCYLPYALMLMVIWASVSVIRPFAWREYALPLLAIGVVFYLTWAVLHLLGDTPWRPLLTITVPDLDSAVLWIGWPRKMFLSILVPMLLLALAAFNISYARCVMRGKNLRSSFMAFALALCVILLLLQWLKGSFPAVLAAAPAAVLSGYAVLNPRRDWLAELAVLGLLCTAIAVRWT
ncbi:MAG: hypothetical protein IPM46_08545 [Flavobacteriales bacterium]|nr:hypothetical protein [Flavobacteriales bacterium]